jgi:heptosyltransferase-2
MEAGRGLIIFPGALGDLICLLPAIHALHGKYPGIEFELMARAELARFAAVRMQVVAGHSIDRREVASLFSEGGGELALVRNFFGQYQRIDSFFASDNKIFRSSLEQAAQSKVSFYPFRPAGSGHVAECYLRVIGAIVPQPLDARVDVLPDDLRDAQRRLSRLGLRPGRFVLVLPGSGSARKNWPAENFGSLAERTGQILPVLFVLGPAETGLGSIFRARSLPIISEIELGELAGLARMSRCFIGNDSGVSHLAAAAGARGAVIFGPADPDRWRPLGKVKIVRSQSLDTLSPGEVWLVLAKLIETDP